MGGIGITPGISMLRTMRDKKDKRKVTLIYGNENLEETTFYEELEELNKELNLQLVHLLTDPPKAWEGETGKIDREFLEKYLPEDSENYIYLICGPDPLMDIAEIALKDLGVDWRYIYTERFKIV
jgi:ferredoxin-NADP reductase